MRAKGSFSYWSPFSHLELRTKLTATCFGVVQNQNRGQHSRCLATDEPRRKSSRSSDRITSWVLSFYGYYKGQQVLKELKGLIL